MKMFSIKDELQRIRLREAEREKRSSLLLDRTDPRDFVSRHLSCQSGFCRACVAQGFLSQEQMRHAAMRYRLGVTRNGGVIFWQIGLQGQVYDGKVMHYRSDCHRDHSHHPSWVISMLKGFYDCPVEIPHVHCLFGTHLLAHTDDSLSLADTADSAERGFVNEACVVEAEKTAVIMSERYPQQLWLAAGGLNELTPQKLFPLRGHRIILFPDTDPDGKAFRLWYDIAQKAQWLLGQNIFVSPLLELHATPEQKRRKIDLVDFLFESHTDRTDPTDF